MPIFIRKAEPGDTAALVAFNQAMARETEGKELDTQVLERGVAAVFTDPNKGFYLVAEGSGEIIAGLLVTFEWSDWRNAWFWWIQSVFVNESSRGMGVYRMLYNEVRSIAADAGNVCGFRLYVEKDNAAAQAVYNKLGMEETYYLMFEEAKR